MKKFIVCNKNSQTFFTDNLKSNHLIIYCKDLTTIFRAWESQLNNSIQKITIHVSTTDPTLSIDPIFISNLEISTSVKEITFNCFTHNYWLFIILSLCPNVEKLYFFKLTKEKLQYVAENLERVTIVKCDFMETDTLKFYQDLISQKKGVNTDIKINYN